jgi:sugar phosphate isomerase/epimerase
LRDDELGETTRSAWRSLLEIAPLLSRSVPGDAVTAGSHPAGKSGRSVPLVSGFAGRIPGKGVEDSLEAWKVIFGPLAERAAALGTCLAFENCRIGDTWKTGRWNIAINPDAWDLMFAALPRAPIGLEWEPCHQMEALADPLMQISTWSSRILHIHGKDARIDREVLARSGLYGRRRFHESCFPGNGDTDWAQVFALLEASGYQGTIDIEGWNDASWSGDRELEGQRRALDYLRARRGQSVGLRVVPD